MKKSISLFILFIFVLLILFSGCGSKSSVETGRKTLTLAVFEGKSQLQGSNLLKYVDSYNENHEDIQIEVINYLDRYSDPNEALDKLKIEINAGQGPDMIDFGRQYSPLDASCGMLADLYPFMQNDPSFNKDEYYYNILEAFHVGDGLYVLVPSYSIDSYATTNINLAGLERMNIEQLSDAYSKLDEESILFPGETKKAVLGMICYGSLENYIDWDAGVCSFNSESFQKLLQFADQFPHSLNISDDYSIKQMVTEGRVLIYPVYIDNVYGMTGVRILYGETPTYIGYPFDSGCGSMAAISNIAIGISSTSQNKEDAWAFLRGLLDCEFQDSINNGLPVRVSSLAEKIEEAMHIQYEDNNEKMVRDVIRFDGEDPINIYEISAEDAHMLLTVIQNIEFNTSIDSNLYTIIMEETDYLFHNDRSVREVADIIQRRASIYISERK